MCPVRAAWGRPRPGSARPLLTPRPLTRSSKSTGDPWLTDGSYLDGSGFARIGVERQMGTTKRFELEMRLVSSHGIIFFLQHEAGRPRPAPGPAPDSDPALLAPPPLTAPPRPPRSSSCAWPCGAGASSSSTTWAPAWSRPSRCRRRRRSPRPARRYGGREGGHGGHRGDRGPGRP